MAGGGCSKLCQLVILYMYMCMLRLPGFSSRLLTSTEYENIYDSNPDAPCTTVQASMHTGDRLRNVVLPHTVVSSSLLFNAILSSLYDDRSCIVQDSFNLIMCMLMMQDSKLDW